MRFAVGGSRLVLAAVLLAWPSLALAQDMPGLAQGLAPADTPSQAILPVSVPSEDSVSAPPAARLQSADFLDEVASDDARRVADWVVRSDDNAGMPFVIVDKLRAKVFVFDGSGRLHGATLALLGKAVGDDSYPGVGNMKLSAMPLEAETTPAGRFMASLAHERNVPFLWVDHDLALSLHRVVHGAPGENRLARLATTATDDKRISHGCINVPVKFFDDVVLTTFSDSKAGGIVYILPEVKAVEDVFPAVSGVAAAQAQ